MTKLEDMTQDQLITWISTLPFSTYNKNKIINGIRKYNVENSASIEGSDFIEADIEDIKELTGVSNQLAKALLIEISKKKEPKKKEPTKNGIFSLSLVAKHGVTVKIKNVTKSWKIKDVKAAYLKEQGIFGVADHVNLKQSGGVMQDDKTLEYYKITCSMHMPLVVLFKTAGGGGPSVPGPNLKSELKQDDWDDSAPAYRVATGGLNIEWVHNGKKVIGQVGYTTCLIKFPKGVFDAARHKYIKMAYCPSEKIYCPSSKAIVRYGFCNCKVVFDGELDDGTEIYETKVYGNKYCYYQEGATYSCLTMKVTPN